MSNIMSFYLPSELEASEPPEERGLNRDQVRLMVSYKANNRYIHTNFHDIGSFFVPGDVIVINTSKTLNASIVVEDGDRVGVGLHLCTQLPSGLWVVEVFMLGDESDDAIPRIKPGESIKLLGGASITLHVPYLQRGDVGLPPDIVRCWVATFLCAEDIYQYLDKYGKPIRHKHVLSEWPNSYYQTVYATQPGSAEIPSAGRPFTCELLTRLMAIGVRIAPVVLHTSGASVEDYEQLIEEYYSVPLETVQLINIARASSNRVIAVGTTVVRALETVVDRTGAVHPGEGWTNLAITPDYRIRTVDGLLTGLHEPSSTHLSILVAMAGHQHIEMAYKEALAQKYLWHEFGDTHLIMA